MTSRYSQIRMNLYITMLNVIKQDKRSISLLNVNEKKKLMNKQVWTFTYDESGQSTRLVFGFTIFLKNIYCSTSF